MYTAQRFNLCQSQILTVSISGHRRVSVNPSPFITSNSQHDHTCQNRQFPKAKLNNHLQTVGPGLLGAICFHFHANVDNFWINLPIPNTVSRSGGLHLDADFYFQTIWASASKVFQIFQNTNRPGCIVRQSPEFKTATLYFLTLWQSPWSTAMRLFAQLRTYFLDRL